LTLCAAEYISLSDLTGKSAEILRPRHPMKHLTRRTKPASGVSVKACYFPPLSFSLARRTCDDLPSLSRADVVPSQKITCAEIPDIAALDISSELKLVNSLKGLTEEELQLSFGDCGEPGSLPDVDPSGAVVAFVITDEKSAELADQFGDESSASSYMAPVLVLRTLSLSESESRVKAAIAAAMHAATPVGRMEALESIKAASVKLGVLGF